MSLFPCGHCGQRYPGRAASFYPAIVRGTIAVREKVRLCPACTLRLTLWADSSMAHSMDGQVSLTCSWCTESRELLFLFLTAFVPSEERQDWAGAVCEQHVAQQVVPSFWGPQDAAQAIQKLENGPVVGVDSQTS